MQPTARQRDFDRTYNARKGRGPQISVTDSSHHVTEAIGGYYDEAAAVESEQQNIRASMANVRRPYSFLPSGRDEQISTAPRRKPIYAERQTVEQPNSPRTPLGRTGSNERVSANSDASTSPKSLHRMGSDNSATSTPSLSRQPSSDTAVQQFPLNDIDYESSPAAVAQELSNLQAIRRMSMNVDAVDPDLPSYGLGSVPTVAPKHGSGEEDTSRLFWVPARLHPELAPKEFKTFIEDKVDKIRRRSGDSDSLSVDGLERSGSGSSTGSGIARKKSMLSHQIDPRGSYEDGAERLERKRSKRLHVSGEAQVDLAELERLVEDPSQLVRRMSLDTQRRSQDSGVEVSPNEDMPILPPIGTLKRSTRTTYRRGSLRKGERVPFSKRARDRQNAETDTEPESPIQSPVLQFGDNDSEPILGLTRVQTEPTPQTSQNVPTFTPRTTSRRPAGLGVSHSTDDLQLHERDAIGDASRIQRRSPPPREEDDHQHHHQHYHQHEHEHIYHSPQPQTQHSQQQQQDATPQKQFQSRIASQGRTTAQLPGYNNTNPLPHIIETLPDGTKVPVGQLAQQAQQPRSSSDFPERKSSHDLPRPYQRGGAHARPVAGRQTTKSSTLDDISSRPTPLPGSGGTNTDALTMVPTYDDQKSSKKDTGKKSSWKWILGNDDEERKSKEEPASDSASIKSNKSKAGRLTKADKSARLDVLQTSIDGGSGSSASDRGRESLVLDRASIKLDEEREKTSKQSKKSKEKEKDSGLLSSIFGGKKKVSDTDLKERKRKPDGHLSPEPPPRILKPDIDYNWTRFSILEERAIYRMAHIKLANPRRALHSQVLLSNFMYSYLAKVQMMHPQIQIPPAQQKAQQRGQRKDDQPAEYSQYQRWQEQQSRQEPPPSQPQEDPYDNSNSGYDQQDEYAYVQDQATYGHARGRHTEEYTGHQHDYSGQNDYGSQQYIPQYTRNGASGSGYSVSSGHDYLGYPTDRQPFQQQSLWDDEEKNEELW